MNWKSLRDFCNSLPESELDKNVILWREDEAITDITAEQLDQDMYLHIGEEEDGCFPLCEAESMIKNDPDEYPNEMGDFQKVYDKGHPILHENF